MVTRKEQYPSCFSTSMNNYLLKETGGLPSANAPRYNKNIVERMNAQIIHDLIKNILTNPYEHQKIKAIQQLGSLGSGGYETKILEKILYHDPNLELRRFAKQSLDLIKSRSLKI